MTGTVIMGLTARHVIIMRRVEKVVPVGALSTGYNSMMIDNYPPDEHFDSGDYRYYRHEGEFVKSKIKRGVKPGVYSSLATVVISLETEPVTDKKEKAKILLKWHSVENQ